MTYAQPPPPIPIPTPTPTPKKENRQKGTKTELLRLLGGFFLQFFALHALQLSEAESKLQNSIE